MTGIEEVIRGRRSIGKVKDDPVPKELVEKLLDAAIWAPNHHHTEPWKFIVMTGEGRRTLGQVYVECAADAIAALPESEQEERRRKEMAKAFRSPVVIAAACVPSDSPKAVLAEELAAVHAAVQNLLLTAHAEGLGGVWRTGVPAYDPAMKKALQLEDHAQVVGLIFIGYPDMQAPTAKRTPASAKTVWIEQ
ncbi:nitroreductase [Cohnella kolymensis]|uniref:Putative NAD(P)H nitroreductase n=1 Tax=Cohnella kolymensis TaxID=1590652 RepID=A0ABR5A3S4_9BACL|nr:nitroreductase [Cohnella kolymensis]KIL35067.1 nitroreductase [Cohnella kolymensis]